MKQIAKRLCAAIAAVTALFGSQTLRADTWTDTDGVTWTYTVNDTSATITKAENAEYDVTIPSKLGGKTVVSFGNVFQGNTKISEIVIPNGVTAIAANAFDNCEQLQRVTVGTGVKSVGNYAFRRCSLLQQISLPAATTTLGTGAFAYCVKLNTAKLPGVASIPGAGDNRYAGGYNFDGYGAFYGCDKLRTLQLGGNLAYIGNGAFYDCNELYEVVIPDSVTTIGNYAFAECDKLHDLIIGSTVVSIGTSAFYNDVQLEKLTFKGEEVRTLGASAFCNCENLQSLSLPAGLATIGEYCFKNCDSIPSLTIPDSVTVCTNGAFAYCDGLKTVKVGAGLKHIAGAGEGRYAGGYNFDGYGVFYGCTALTSVTLNSTLQSIGRGAFYGCSALTSIVIPNSVRTIDGYAFASCGLLKNVSIGNGVRLIGDCAFLGDSKLEAVIFGAKVQTIQSQAFDGCAALKSFELPDTVLTIDSYAFRNCRSLTVVTLPDSVGTMGAGCFAYCTGLKTIVIGNGVEEITGAGDGRYAGGYNFDGYGAFYGCTALTDVTIGASVATIGRGAFYGCTALQYIRIPSCVSTIGGYSFAKCTALTKVDVENNGVTLIDDYAFNDDTALVTANLGNRLVKISERAFRNCGKLSGLVLPDSLITLDGWCFENCKSLASIVIPNKVKDLNSGAFAYCTGLKYVKIGSSVSTICGAGDSRYAGGYNFDGYGAFYGCTALVSVNLGTTLSEIGTGAFYGCTALPSIVIPDSVTKIGGYAFGNCTSLVKATLGTGVATMGNNVFNGDTALHYVEFKGAAAPANMGSNIYNGTRDRFRTYVASGSTGWVGLYQSGLPETWQGRAIAYGPPPTNAGNPYDFCLVTPTDRVSGKDYAWPSPIMLTTNSYVCGRTVPASAATIREGDTIYLTYAFDEYWRGAAFNVTNRFTLSGAKSATFDLKSKQSAHGDYNYLWTTNATPAALKNLAPGKYRLKVQLNNGNALKETDYSNNSTSITFTVVAAPKYTVKFSLNGASGTAPASRTIYQGKAVGSLPSPSAKSGWTFLGWFTAASGGSKVSASTVPAANATYYAHWAKTDLAFYTLSGEGWKQGLFLAKAASGGTHVSTFTQGEGIYLHYSFRNAADSYAVGGFVNRFTLSNGKTFDDSWAGYTLAAGKVGWGGDDWKPSALQNLAPGSYTLTCRLDATGKVGETNEGNNSASVKFTVVARSYSYGSAIPISVSANGKTTTVTPTVGQKWGSRLPAAPTPRSGYTFAGWYTAANGKGTRVTADTVVGSTPITLYAYFVKKQAVTPYALYTSVAGAAPGGAASEYNGYLVDAKGAVKGTIQVKLGKPNAKSGEAAVKGTVQIAGAKKIALKASGGKAKVATGGVTTVAVVGGEGGTVTLGAKWMGGKYGSWTVCGARNLFASKDKAESAAAEKAIAPLKTAFNVVWSGGNANATVAAKGKTKTKGVFASGAKLTASGVLLVGEKWACAPVVSAKSATAFLVWISKDGKSASVAGLGSGAVAGKAGTLSGSPKFTLTGSFPAKIGGANVAASFLPSSVPLTVSGGKVTVPKANKIIRDSSGLLISMGGTANHCDLKFSYAAKTGSFKGSFVVYTNTGSLKKHKATFSGVLVNGVGYGTATIKGVGSAAVTVK